MLFRVSGQDRVSKAIDLVRIAAHLGEFCFFTRGFGTEGDHLAGHLRGFRLTTKSAQQRVTNVLADVVTRGELVQEVPFVTFPR